MPYVILLSLCVCSAYAVADDDGVRSLLDGEKTSIEFILCFKRF